VKQFAALARALAG